MEPPPPPGLLLLGGQSTEGQLTSIETFGLDNCNISSLPETRYGFGSFITPTQPPQLAVCGGWWMGKPISTDCLTLNVTSGQWERGTFTNGLSGLSREGVRGLINMEDHGVFAVHASGISILAPGSRSWAGGPIFLTSAAECGCNVSRTNFVTIHMSDTNNVREYSVTNGEAKPIDSNQESSWPNLRTKRHSPGCGATSYHLVVAGGVSDWDEVLTSVEVYHIETKALRRVDMRHARAYFQIIPVGSTHPRLLAIGGQGAYSTLDTSEWWQEEENSWEEGPTLTTTGRSSFSSLMAPPHLVCSDVEPPSYSCPASQNPGQTCAFPTVEPGALIIKNYKGVCKSVQYTLSIIIEGHTSYPGETAHVCLSQDNEFICPTTNTSTTLTCDRDRCPLQGPPMAPIMEPQPTGCLIPRF